MKKKKTPKNQTFGQNLPKGNNKKKYDEYDEHMWFR